MPTLFITCGLPCAGKTTVARRIESEIGALRLTTDEWLITLFPEETRPQMDSHRMAVEELQWVVAQRCLSLGVDVVLDHGLWSREERDVCREAARARGCNVVLCLVDPPLDEIFRRIDVRNANLGTHEFVIDKAEVQVWNTQFERPTAKELALFDPEPE